MIILLKLVCKQAKLYPTIFDTAISRKVRCDKKNFKTCNFEGNLFPENFQVHQ